MYFTIHNKFEKSKCWRGFFRGKYPEFSTRERGETRGSGERLLEDFHGGSPVILNIIR